MGEALSATRYNELIRYVRSLRLLQGPNVRLDYFPNGTFIRAKAVQEAPKVKDPRYWRFAATEDDETHVRTGGWSRAIAQYGYEIYRSSDLIGPDYAEIVYDEHTDDHQAIAGLGENADGYYYLEADFAPWKSPDTHGHDGPKLKLIRLDAPETRPIRYDEDKVRVYIGTVEDGKEKDTIGIMPVFYFNV